jgi:lysozyme
VNLTSILRYLQGERRGMGSQLRKPDADQERFFGVLYPSAPTITIQTSVQLSDVSFWQDAIDFGVMHNAGLDGVIIRAGQRNWVDSKFRDNWTKAKAAGLPRGSYWFYDSRETPKKQAELWASLLDGDPGELAHACDFEETYGGAYGTKAHFKEFINRFQDLTGFPDKKVLNYTGFFWWLERVGNDVFFKRFQLWLAWYSAMENVRVPAPWSQMDLLLWQYTSSGNGTAYGVSSREIDLNWFYGTDVEYKQRFALGNLPPAEPPEEGETMKGTVLLGYNLNIRRSDNNEIVGTLRVNDVVYGQVTSNRIYYNKIYRANGTIETPGAMCSSAVSNGATPAVYWMRLTNDTEPPVEPPLPSTEYILHVKDGVTRKFIPESTG